MTDEELESNAEKLIKQISMIGLLSNANYPNNKDLQHDDYIKYSKMTVVTFLKDFISPKWKLINTVPFDQKWEGGYIFKDQAYYADKKGNVILHSNLIKSNDGKGIGFLGLDFKPTHWMPFEMPQPPEKRKK
jgi:hypothetical protein